jgi:hypothetical protein
VPTNYPGVPTATQAPSAAPGPGVFPTGALPADGDNENAATWAQPYKVLLDFMAYHADPFAIVGSWAQPVARWRNALLQEKARIDHMGYPGGNIQQLVETWRGPESQVGSGAVVFEKTNLRWSIVVTSTAGGQVAIADPDSSGTFATRNVAMSLGTGASDLVTMLAVDRAGLFGPLQGLAMEWDIRTGAAVDQMHWTGGLGSSMASAYLAPIAGFIGAVFYKGNANANWQVVAGDGTALSTVVDSGVAVAAATHYKMRIEYLGSGVADDGASAVRAYINGVNVTPSPIITHLPGLGGLLDIATPYFAFSRDTGSTTRTVSIGQVRYSQNF